MSDERSNAALFIAGQIAGLLAPFSRDDFLDAIKLPGLLPDHQNWLKVMADTRSWLDAWPATKVRKP